MDTLKQIEDFLTGVPSSFWGVLFGSILSLAGVHLSNSASARRQREQVRSDREEKETARRIEAKRQTYLALMDEITELSSALGQMINPDISEADLARLSDRAAATAKLTLVADLQTAEHLLRGLGRLRISFVKLYAQRADMMIAWNDAKTAERLRDKALADGQQVTEAMRQRNLSMDFDPAVWETFKRLADEASQRFHEQEGIRKTHFQRFFAHQRALLAASMQCTRDVGDALGPGIDCIRQELGYDVGMQQLVRRIGDETQAAQVLEQMISAVAVKTGLATAHPMTPAAVLATQTS